MLIFKVENFQTFVVICSSFKINDLFNQLSLFFSQAIACDKFLQGLIENGVYSAIPFLACSLVALTNGLVADFMRAKCFSTTAVRKMFTCTCKLCFARKREREREREREKEIERGEEQLMV